MRYHFHLLVFGLLVVPGAFAMVPAQESASITDNRIQLGYDGPGKGVVIDRNGVRAIVDGFPFSDPTLFAGTGIQNYRAGCVLKDAHILCIKRSYDEMFSFEKYFTNYVGLVSDFDFVFGQENWNSGTPCVLERERLVCRHFNQMNTSDDPGEFRLDEKIAGARALRAGARGVAVLTADGGISWFELERGFLARIGDPEKFTFHGVRDVFVSDDGACVSDDDGVRCTGMVSWSRPRYTTPTLVNGLQVGTKFVRQNGWGITFYDSEGIKEFGATSDRIETKVVLDRQPIDAISVAESYEYGGYIWLSEDGMYYQGTAANAPVRVDGGPTPDSLTQIEDFVGAPDPIVIGLANGELQGIGFWSKVFVANITRDLPKSRISRIVARGGTRWASELGGLCLITEKKDVFCAENPSIPDAKPLQPVSVPGLGKVTDVLSLGHTFCFSDGAKTECGSGSFLPEIPFQITAGTGGVSQRLDSAKYDGRYYLLSGPDSYVVRIAAQENPGESELVKTSLFSGGFLKLSGMPTGLVCGIKTDLLRCYGSQGLFETKLEAAFDIRIFSMQRKSESYDSAVCAQDATGVHCFWEDGQAWVPDLPERPQVISESCAAGKSTLVCRRPNYQSYLSYPPIQLFHTESER